MWKANGQKRGQRDSVLHAITVHSTTRPRLFGSHFGVYQKNPCHLATVNGVRVGHSMLLTFRVHYMAASQHGGTSVAEGSP